MKKQVLIISQDIQGCERIKENLENEKTEVQHTQTVVDGTYRLLKNSYQLVIVNISQSQEDGIKLLSTLRELKPMPILVLSDNSDTMHMVDVFTHGADDFLLKPYDIAECAIRAYSLLRRYTELNPMREPNYTVIKNQDLLINSEHRQVFLGGEEIELTRKEFDMLLLLASHPERVFTYEQIYQNVWNEDFLEDKNRILCHVSRLRKKLDKPNVIKSVHDVGYLLDLK